MRLEKLLEIEEFVIGDVTYENDLMDAVTIDSSDLNNEFIRHTKLAVLYGFAAEKAAAYATKLEVDLDRVYALLDARTREESDTKLTEPKIKNKILTSDEYVILQDKLLKAKEQAGLLKAAKEAMNHRLQSLIQLGNTERALIKAEPMIVRG